jgi:hypothetical protein
MGFTAIMSTTPLTYPARCGDRELRRKWPRAFCLARRRRRARLRHRGLCTRPALPGFDRCQWHGGLSTGPRSVDDRRRYVDDVKETIKRGKIDRVPWGRKPGGRNRPKGVIEADKAERVLRRVERLGRGERAARKRAARRDEKELARRHRQFQSGLLFWLDDEPLRWT